MIFSSILTVIVAALNAIFSYFPQVTTLPTFGSVNLDSVFTTGVQYFNYLSTVFPPLTTIKNAAIIYITFKASMMFLKLVLGHRAPVARE